MIDECAEEVVKRLSDARNRNKAIDYGIGRRDLDVPEIIWTTYGLPESNEIVVTATVGALCLGIAAQSSLTRPAMVDRRFGSDADDLLLAGQLSVHLWCTQADRLIGEAERLRQIEDERSG
jgi:hypothetical protein